MGEWVSRDCRWGRSAFRGEDGVRSKRDVPVSCREDTARRNDPRLHHRPDEPEAHTTQHSGGGRGVE